MLSAVGACVTVVGSIGAGYCLCREKSERAAQLFLLGRMFEMTAGEIGYSRSFLPDIFSETGRRLGRAQKGASAELGSVLIRAGERMLDEKGQPVETIWKEEMGIFLKKLLLTADEEREVLSFPDAVCYLDGERQKQAIERFAVIFRERAEEALKKAGQEKRTVMAVSAACGMLTALLLVR